MRISFNCDITPRNKNLTIRTIDCLHFSWITYRRTCTVSFRRMPPECHCPSSKFIRGSSFADYNTLQGIISSIAISSPEISLSIQTPNLLNSQILAVPKRLPQIHLIIPMLALFNIALLSFSLVLQSTTAKQVSPSIYYSDLEIYGLLVSLFWR